MPDTQLQILDASNERFHLPFRSLGELLKTRVVTWGDKLLYRYLEDGLIETDRITYRQLWEKSVKVAASIQSKCNKGDRIIMLFPAGIGFIVSLFGCFLSGTVGVPVYTPKKNRGFDRFSSILSNCQPSLILGTERLLADVENNFKEEPVLRDIPKLSYESSVDSSYGSWAEPDIDPDDPAILQYTSGSTGDPNGVTVTHGNILFNSEFIKRAFGHDENLVGMNWLPGFHDMGLIGALLQPVYVGGNNSIIPPGTFLLRPQNWLKSIGKYKAVTAGGPNFAFDYCCERISDDMLDDIDLHTVRPLFCGAEPIKMETLEKFAEKFKDCNFSIDQFYPCYGLAENTLIVTGGELDAKPVYLNVDAKKLEQGVVEVASANSESPVQTLVGCGYPMVGTTVCIVDPTHQKILQNGKVGEIWVSGPSVARSYWHNDRKSKETFHAFTDNGKGPFMRTGDLGFIHGGQLFITGRIKDLIIIRGLNHYPHDIEHTVENSHDALQLSGSAAFSADMGHGEELVIVCEVKRTAIRTLDADEVIRRLRESISAKHQVEIAALTLVRPGSIPKTSSGKIRRIECRKEFLKGNLQAIAEWAKPKVKPGVLQANESEILMWMKNWVAAKLEVDVSTIDTNLPLAEIGLDSILGVVMAKDAEEEFGMEWPIDLFLEETTLRKIAQKGAEILREIV
jgi:acyl-CoA synthetase (AMP-forming)/AMP-acid ligase II/acyl carrier protein